MTTPRAALALLPAALLALAPAPAAAQGEDAFVLPRGALELTAGGSYGRFEETFGGGPLGTPFVAPLAPSRFPGLPSVSALQAFFDAAADSLGGTAYAVSDADRRVGTLTPELAGDLRRAPLRIRYGLFGRVTLGVSIPFERQGTVVRVPRLVGAALGLNPDATENAERFAALDPALESLGRATYLPIATSAAGMEMQRRYIEYTGGADTLELPTSQLSPAQLDALLLTAGIATNPLIGDRTPYRPGDLEVSARIQLLNTTGSRIHPGVGGRGIRAAVELTGRAPTGKGSDLDSLLWITSESGFAGASAAGMADVFRGRLWISGYGRYTQLFARDVVRRTFIVDDPFAPLSERFLVRYEPGARLELAVTPRWRLTDEITFAGRYAYARAGETTMDAGDDPVPGAAFAGIDVLGEQSSQIAGLGLSYGSLAAFEAGNASVPFEASLLYERAVAGSGAAPELSRVTLQGRIFYPFFGRPRRAASDSARADSVPPPPPPPPAATAAPATPLVVPPPVPDSARVVPPPASPSAASPASPTQPVPTPAPPPARTPVADLAGPRRGSPGW